MDILRSLLLAVYFSLCLQEGKGQLTELTVPLHKFSDCNNGSMTGVCLGDDRIFVHYMFGGTKNSSYDCPYYKNASYPETCCTLDETEDCYKTLPDTSGIAYRSGCIGRVNCPSLGIGVTDADDNCTDIPYTHYLGIAFYCFDIDSIGTLSSANKRNDGQGSLLHLWGVGDVYGMLPSGQFPCSVETDCDDSIYVISMDVRFQNVSGNCLDENTISIMDDRTTTFTCTSNNNFVIQQLYRSNRHYITLTYDGHTTGGYLWLTFISTGNLTLNCPARDPENDCPYPSTTEGTTFTTEETTTTGTISTTETTTTGTTSTTETTPTEETTTTGTTSTEETTTTRPTSTEETTTGTTPTTETTVTEETTITGTTPTEETTTGTTPTTETTVTEETTITETTPTEETTSVTTSTTHENLTTEGPSYEDSTNDQNIGIIVGVVVTLVLLVALLLLVLGCRDYKVTKKADNKHQKHTDGLDIENGDVDSKTKMIKSVNSNGLLVSMPPSSIKDPSHKERKKKKKKKLINSKEKMTKHQSKNESENGERTKCENIPEEYENKEESECESKNDHNSKSFVDNSENVQNVESDSIIMENKHIQNSDIVKSEKKDENEQIPNGGPKIILKDDGKTLNKNDNIDIPTTNNKEINESKSGETKKKKKRQKKKSINNEILATCDEKEVKPNNTGHYDKITPVYDNLTAVYDNVTPVSIN